MFMAPSFITMQFVDDFNILYPTLFLLSETNIAIDKIKQWLPSFLFDNYYSCIDPCKLGREVVFEVMMCYRWRARGWPWKERWRRKYARPRNR